jgi:hypothetical protein
VVPPGTAARTLGVVLTIRRGPIAKIAGFYAYSAANWVVCIGERDFWAQRQPGREIAHKPETVSAENETPRQIARQWRVFGRLQEMPRFERVRGGPERTRTACQARSRYRTGLWPAITRINAQSGTWIPTFPQLPLHNWNSVPVGGDVRNNAFVEGYFLDLTWHIAQIHQYATHLGHPHQRVCIQ